MEKRVPVKTLYLLLVISIGLVALGVGSTYAMFTASVEIDSPITLSSSLSHVSDAMEVIEVTIGGGKTVTSTLNITNSSTSSVNYTTWYVSDSNFIDIGINSDSAATTGSLASSGTATIKVNIRNNGKSSSTVTLGVSSSTDIVVLGSGMVVVPNEELPAGGTNVMLIDHIRSQYASNVSETPTNTGNGTYYYADSVRLMNDGLNITGTAITDTASLLAGTSGNIRYYGAEGDTLNNYIYFNCDTYPETNCEKWRIIGIVDGKVKIIRGEQIGTYSWDYTSTGAYDNNWSNATLMTLLNDRYYYSRDNVLYYNNSTTPVTINFGNPGVGEVKGITAATRNKNIIANNVTWYINGVSSNNLYPNAVYEEERTGNRTLSGSMALLYPSDYGYSTNLSICNKTMSNYNDSSCADNNWMKNLLTNTGTLGAWLLSPLSTHVDNVWRVNTKGVFNYDGVLYSYYVSPVLYLDSSVIISYIGDGSSDEPYRIVTE